MFKYVPNPEMIN